jgi:hypothetical protein
MTLSIVHKESAMTQIGRPIREITVEPLQIPVPRREPTPTVPVSASPPERVPA